MTERERLFIKLALAQGSVTEDQVREAVESGEHGTVPEILRRNGVLSLRQARSLRSHLEAHKFECDACGREAYRSEAGGKETSCSDCANGRGPAAKIQAPAAVSNRVAKARHRTSHFFSAEPEGESRPPESGLAPRPSKPRSSPRRPAPADDGATVDFDAQQFADDSRRAVPADDGATVNFDAQQFVQESRRAAPTDETVDFGPDEAEAPEDPYIGKEIGGCRIESFLGKGGMGSVYLATHLDLDRKVAFKVLSEELTRDPAQVDQFFREARALARLEHANIVTIYNVGKEDQVHFLQMQLVEGGSLEDWLKKNGTPSPEVATEQVAQIAVGLHEAHKKGIVHRDIKPDNVLVADGPTLKITDFGLARMDEDPGFSTNRIVGTPYFMAPEQIDGRNVDPRTDLYALGATFYYLLTGKHPFEADSAVEVLLMHVNDTLRPPREIAPHVPEALSRIVCRAMAKDPDDRYASLKDFLKDLRTAQRGKQVAVAAEVSSAAVAPLLSVMHDPSGAPADMAALLQPIAYHKPRAFYVAAGGVAAAFAVTVILAMGPLRNVLLADQVEMAAPGDQAAIVDPAATLALEAAHGLAEQRQHRRAADAYREVASRHPDVAEEAKGRAEAIVAEARSDADERLEKAEELRAARRFGEAIALLDLYPEGFHGLGAEEEVADRAEEVRRALREERGIAFVAAGQFIAGDDEGSTHNPRRKLTTGAFYIDLHEVTNADYARFLDESPEVAPPAHWSGRRTPPAGLADLPITGITWREASRYAESRDGRLPTPAEWEKAARGVEGNKWPWGDQRLPRACNHVGYDVGAPVKPGTVKGDVSPYGCFDMAGNVSEWTYGPPPNPQSAQKAGPFVFGGAFHTHLELTRAAYYYEPTPGRDETAPAIGFRCVYDEL